MQGTGIVMGGKECYAMDSSFFSWAHHAAWLWLHNMKWNRIRCFAYWPKGCDAAVGWWSRTECIGLRTPLKCHEKSPVGLKSWMWGFKVQQRFELEVDGEMNSSSYLAWYLHLVGTISTTTSTTIPEMYCTTFRKNLSTSLDFLAVGLFRKKTRQEEAKNKQGWHAEHEMQWKDFFYKFSFICLERPTKLSSQKLTERKQVMQFHI